MPSKLTPDTPARLGRDKRMPPGRSILGGATIVEEGRLADVLAAAAAVPEGDRDLLWIAIDDRDRNLRWHEIASLLSDDGLLA